MAIGRSLGGDNGIVHTLHVAVPSGTNKYEPVVVGSLTGIALSDRDTNGNAVIAIAPSQVFRMSVNASTDVDTSPFSAASAVALGDRLYVEAGSQVVSKDSSDDTAFGIALGTRDPVTGAYVAAGLDAGEVGECDVLLTL